MAQGGIGLLAQTADDAEDPQTLRMVAGAIANLCGNGNLASFIEITCFLCVCSFTEASVTGFEQVEVN
jgi:hypothetical protein